MYRNMTYNISHRENALKFLLRVFLITSKSLQGRLISLSHVRIFCCINMTKFINILNYLFFQNRITM
ncbi:hypothetical protein SaSA201_0970 [Streptococcus agalactiae]|nr:hypothetical protein SaSA20_0930b [Streptococcus agalactiae]EAO74426.1 hypothetical protein SAM_1121 [Streptococcus agalactiae CJB111]AUO83736.1 hypothetical protein SaSA53_0964 [Streptococcus agalactiae]AUO91963.1 hypothetical protein SaSA16_0964 [Streptococcus agalactiae]AUO96972.1 hypothetical protein SaSA81_0965 [Streptococcus agalactiae]